MEAPIPPDHSHEAPLKEGEASAASYVEWYRLALFLTGNPQRAAEVLRNTIAEAAGEFGQLRNKESRRFWLARKIRSGSLKLAGGGSPAEEPAGADAALSGDLAPGLAQKVAALPEPGRSAFALFHTLEADTDELAELIGVRETKFAEILASARHELAPEAVFPEPERLRLYKPWGQNAREVAKAAAVAKKKPETEAPLAAQAAFDRQCHQEWERVRMPAGLSLPKLIEPAPPGWRMALRQPAVLSIGLAVLVVLGVAVVLMLHKLDDFPGKDAVAEIVEDAGDADGGGLVEVPATEAGKLGDWFMLNGFESFAVPPELARAGAVGARVSQYQGQPVAEVALAKSDALLFVFRGADLKVSLSQKWVIFQQDAWSVAARGYGANAIIVAFKGDSEGMENFLKTVGK